MHACLSCTSLHGGWAAQRLTLYTCAAHPWIWFRPPPPHTQPRTSCPFHPIHPQEATHIEDIDQLVSTFMAAEDQNYTLFNYVNEVNQEIEKLEDQITIMRREIGRYRESGQELDRTKSKEAFEGVTRLAATEAQSQLYDRRHDAAQQTSGVLKAAIRELFERIGCNTPAVRDLLGDDGVTEGNLMAYLGIIEQRTNEILQVRARSGRVPTKGRSSMGQQRNSGARCMATEWHDAHGRMGTWVGRSMTQDDVPVDRCAVPGATAHTVKKDPTHINVAHACAMPGAATREGGGTHGTSVPPAACCVLRLGSRTRAQVYARRKAAAGTEGLQEALMAQPLTQPGNRIIIEPPSTTVEEEVEGVEPEPVEEDKPLSRDALESKVQRTLPRKLETAIKVKPAGADTQGKRSPGRR